MDPAEPEPRPCLNCGAALTGPYCAACGQPDSEYGVLLVATLASITLTMVLLAA